MIGKYQKMDQDDLSAGRPLKYHTPAIKRAKSSALKNRKVNQHQAFFPEKTKKEYSDMETRNIKEATKRMFNK